MSQITVGIPVYNNGSTLRRTVESVLAQTRQPAAIEISDNNSSDDTRAVALDLAARHPIVRVIRQSVTLNPTENFRAVLQVAQTPYFMWLAADDYLLPTFLERCGERLDTQPGVIACVSRVQFTTDDVPVRVADGSRPIRGSVRERLAQYYEWPGDNVRIYGLYRTEALRGAIPASHIYAWDWAAVGGTLLHGGHDEVDEILDGSGCYPRLKLP